MRLPNGQRAVVDIRKLRDYCLSPEHPRGRHKARIFEAALGLKADRADELQAILVNAALTGDAVVSQSDEYGERYIVDFGVEGRNGPVTIRSAWIVRAGEDFARLTTCFVM